MYNSLPKKNSELKCCAIYYAAIIIVVYVVSSLRLEGLLWVQLGWFSHQVFPEFHGVIELHCLWDILAMLPSSFAEVTAMLCCFPNKTRVFIYAMLPRMVSNSPAFFPQRDCWDMMRSLKLDSHNYSTQCMLTIIINHNHLL